jgi:hypothetical protein
VITLCAAVTSSWTVWGLSLSLSLSHLSLSPSLSLCRSLSLSPSLTLSLYLSLSPSLGAVHGGLPCQLAQRRFQPCDLHALVCLSPGSTDARRRTPTTSSLGSRRCACFSASSVTALQSRQAVSAHVEPSNGSCWHPTGRVDTPGARPVPDVPDVRWACAVPDPELGHGRPPVVVIRNMLRLHQLHLLQVSAEGQQTGLVYKRVSSSGSIAPGRTGRVHSCNCRSSNAEERAPGALAGAVLGSFIGEPSPTLACGRRLRPRRVVMRCVARRPHVTSAVGPWQVPANIRATRPVGGVAVLPHRYTASTARRRDTLE